ncbi:MAG: outer membrane protein assembly factor BamB [Betaproteobacteria bacterium]
MGRRFPGWLAALTCAALLGACSSDKPKPTPLEPLAPKIAGRQVWQVKFTGVQFPLTVATRDGAFIVAGDDGTVLSLEASTGRELWRAQVGGGVSAGVGTDGRFTSVVTRGHEVVTLEQGRVLWKAKLSGRVMTAPLVAGERVFVMGIDRAVHAFDAIDGKKLWVLQRPGDALTLGQAGVVSAVSDTLVVGQGPRMTGVDPLRGTVRWEASVANPRATNEVERLADLVGPAARVGNVLCTRAFQATVGCIDAVRGSLMWSRSTSGSQSIGADDRVVVAGDGSDRLSGWRQGTGELLWTHEKLLFRGLSGVLVAGRTAVVGDAQGFVHFLDREDGQPLLRLSTDGSGVVGAPIVQGATLLVVTRAGGLYAFRPE